MTRDEMLEIFGAFALAYPGAEMFRAGSDAEFQEKLVKIADLWASCLPEVDGWTGKQAAVQLIRSSKYPPTVAEFREQAAKLRSALEEKSKRAWNYAMLSVLVDGSVDRAYNRLSAQSGLRRAIDQMGGTERFTAVCVDGKALKNYKQFQAAYLAQAAAKTKALGGSYT